MEHSVTSAKEHTVRAIATGSNESNVKSILEQPQMSMSESSVSTLAARETSAGQTTTSTTTTTSQAPEVKHLDNLDLHRQPKITSIELMSTSATSSAFPQSLALWISRKGGWILAANSSHLYLLYSPDLPHLSARAFRVRRRPLAAEILEDGSLLCVLSNEHQVDVYSLGEGDPATATRTRTIFLENAAKTMAMTPDGLVLATGSGTAIEIASLAPGARELSKRQIVCEPMDFLSFSDDGRTLLATSSASRQRGSTVFSVNSDFGGPMTEDGMPIALDVDQAWTTQILFPEKALKAQQAVLLPDQPIGAIDRLFAFDSVKQCYGVYELADRAFLATRRFSIERSANALEASAPPEIRQCHIEDVPPATSGQKLYAAAAVNCSGTTEILVHCLKMHGDDEQPSFAGLDGQTEQLPLSLPLARIALFEGARSGGICGLRWSMSSALYNDTRERLIAIGPARKASFLDASSGGPTASRGRVFLLDFGVPGVHDRLYDSEMQPESIVIDLDTITGTENLPGEELAFEDEVNLVRRRTVAQRHANTIRRGTTRNLDRAASAASSRHSRLSGARNAEGSRRRDSSGQFNEDAGAALEEPYTQGAPRPQMSLRRAATVLAESPAARRYLRALPDRPLEYRRADGLRGTQHEIPHESDADNWEPPPPPYSPNADHSAPNLTVPGHIGLQPNLLVPHMPVGQQRPSSRAVAFSTSPTFYQHASQIHSSPDLVPQASTYALGGEPTPTHYPSLMNNPRLARASISNRSMSETVALRQPPPLHRRNSRSLTSLRGNARLRSAAPAPTADPQYIVDAQLGRPKKEKRGLRCVVM